MPRRQKTQELNHDEYKRALIRFLKTIPPSRRIISNHHEVVKPRSSQQRATKYPEMKPAGLWYSVGDSWLEWCLAEDFNLDSTYVHELTINEDLIIKVTNEAEFDALVAEYGIYDEFSLQYQGQTSYGVELPPNYLDWPKLASKYAGLEIAPYLWSKRLNGGLWYYGWDCASGCIWDKAAIQNVRLYAKYHPKVRGFRRVKHEQSQAIRAQCHQTVCVEGG